MGKKVAGRKHRLSLMSFQKRCLSNSRSCWTNLGLLTGIALACLIENVNGQIAIDRNWVVFPPKSMEDQANQISKVDPMGGSVTPKKEVIASSNANLASSNPNNEVWVRFPLQPTTPVQIKSTPQELPKVLEQQPNPAIEKEVKPTVPTIVPTIKGFQFDGVTLIDPQILADQLGKFTGKKIESELLDQITQVVDSLYREKGWLARASLPNQDLTDGHLLINVIESQLSGYLLEDKKELLSNSDIAENITQKILSKNQPLNLIKLNQLNSTLSEIPGIKSTITLQPGPSIGQTEALINIDEGKSVDFGTGIDNGGSRSTGQTRVNSRLQINNPFKIGDSIGIQGMATEGSKYLRGNYSFPFMSNGWRIGVNSSVMHYKLITPEFVNLGAKGPSQSAGLEMMIPITRRNDANLTFQMLYDKKRFLNQTDAGINSKYKAETFGAYLEGNNTDFILLEGQNNWSAQVITGKIDYSESPEIFRIQNSLTTQSEGNFSKLKVAGSRKQKLTSNDSVLFNLQGQVASKNLDGSEKLYLGGPQGVRAYPTHEAGGSQGALATLEFQKSFAVDSNFWTVASFYDSGRVKVNKNNDYSGALLNNLYTLNGYGLYLGTQTVHSKAQSNIRLTWSRRAGKNAGENDTTHLDQDGTRVINRFRLNATYDF